MNLLEALILGILQGLTEFLPISSSAHVKFVKLLLHLESSESQVLFDLICHLGTLTALLYFLREEILSMIRKERKKLLLIGSALAPLIPAYFLLKPLREWASHPGCLGFCLLITSALLFCSKRYRFRKSPPLLFAEQVRSSLWIGAMQSMALIPGISRSASTICCAKALGWEAREAVRFSFLLSIPTIIGGNCLELIKMLYSSHTLPLFSPSVCAVGFITSLCCGLIVGRFALRYLEKGNLIPFAWYCLCAGILVSLYLYLC